MSTATAYIGREDERTTVWKGAARRVSRDCGPIHDCENRARRDATFSDFALFCKTYFPNIYKLPWSDPHRQACDCIEKAVLHGGQFAFAMPRGSGKTSLCESAALWAICHSHAPYVVIVGATEGKAEDRLKSIRTELTINETLAGDFPEICQPLWALGTAWRQADSQHSCGRPTAVEWKVKKVVLPTTYKGEDTKEPYPTSGSIIQVAGLTGEIRGMNHKLQDGSIIRPRLAICDDPQTRQSAKSPTQSETRAQTLAADVAYLAGPGEPISVLVPCTVIYQEDMADQILDRDRHPEYRGIRTQMVNSFPENQGFWDKYAEILKDSLRNDGDHVPATEFYAANRAVMDKGAEVSWPERHAVHELSAIQHAMNLKIRDEASFWSEMQNEPIESQGDDEIMASVADILGKINDYRRFLCPKDTTTITAFVDIKLSLLHYMVVAWSPGFVGQVIDYGTWPDQGTKHRTISMNLARATFETEIGGLSTEKLVYKALRALTSKLLAQKYPVDGGDEMGISKLLVDASLGQVTNTVYQFCRESGQSTVILPSHGRYVGASSQPWAEWRRKRGEKVGVHWRERPSEEWPIRHVVFDANFWKTTIHQFLRADAGGTRTIGIFGRNASGRQLDIRFHGELATQIVAEFPIKTEARGRTVYEWKIKAGRPENDMLDCLVGCAVAASMEGIESEGSKTPHKRRQLPAVDMSKHLNSVRRWQNE